VDNALKIAEFVLDKGVAGLLLILLVVVGRIAWMKDKQVQKLNEDILAMTKWSVQSVERFQASMDSLRDLVKTWIQKG